MANFYLDSGAYGMIKHLLCTKYMGYSNFSLINCNIQVTGVDTTFTLSDTVLQYLTPIDKHRQFASNDLINQVIRDEGKKIFRYFDTEYLGEVRITRRLTPYERALCEKKPTNVHYAKLGKFVWIEGFYALICDETIDIHVDLTISQEVEQYKSFLTV
jgi:hypothetical protein